MIIVVVIGNLIEATCLKKKQKTLESSREIED